MTAPQALRPLPGAMDAAPTWEIRLPTTYINFQCPDTVLRASSAVVLNSNPLYRNIAVQLDWFVRIRASIRNAIVSFVLMQICLAAIGGANPPLQGWINVYEGSAFYSDIDAACPTGRIRQDWYDAGLHECTGLPPTAADAIGWGWVCPKQSSYVELIGDFTCNPNLDAGLYATCGDGTVMVGVSFSHPYGSATPDDLHCPSSAPDTWMLTLAGPGTTFPENGKTSSEVTLTAHLTKNGSVASSVTLDLSVSVNPNSGGHEHDDVNRPKGTLNLARAATDVNGDVKFTFKPPEVAGIHTVKARCNSCANQVASKDIQVKVPDLLPVSPNPPQNVDGTFVYALTSVDKTHQGNGRYHHNQYYLTDLSIKNLRSMIGAFSMEGWGTVALNDASLFWGGRYDITANWTAPHAGHREGREIDISFARAQNPVSNSKQSDFYDKFCKNKKVNFPFSLLHHYVLIPHFHVYLEKQTACWKSEK